MKELVTKFAVKVMFDSMRKVSVVEPAVLMTLVARVALVVNVVLVLMGGLVVMMVLVEMVKLVVMVPGQLEIVQLENKLPGLGLAAAV